MAHLEVKTNVSLAPHTTFGLGGTVPHFLVVTDVTALPAAYEVAQESGLSLLILGGGSNMIIPDGSVSCFVIKIEIKGKEILEDGVDYVRVRLGAGENWDEAVAWAVSQGWSGIEALSAIPGTVGGAPVQNIGAYGSEVKDTLEAVEAFDTHTSQMIDLSKSDCRLAYRDSLFKHEPGRYIITAIILRLSKQAPVTPAYKDVQNYFADRNIATPTLSQIRQAIIEIREHKLPHPSTVPSVGSFFKNPIVPLSVAEELKVKYPDMPLFPAGEAEAKLSGGWLIEQCGLKGQTFGPLAIHDRNALVMTNPGGATYEQVVTLKDQIISQVKDKFGVTLEPEPIFI